MNANWMIYGATGYTAGLVIDLVSPLGEKPILAGRNETAVRAIAERHGWPYRIFDINDVDRAARQLEGIAVVAHLAGPFSQTSGPMIAACLKSRAHYVDITGEIPVFEHVMTRTAKAVEAGVALVPGVGFDVVPSDALAAWLAAALPDAVELELAFGPVRGGAAASRGTLKTMVEHIEYGGRARIDGIIKPVPLTWRTPIIPFAHGPKQCVTLPWGDVSTAYHTTGIPNICVYMAASPRAFRVMDATKSIIAWTPIKRAVQALIGRFVTGPDETARQKHRVDLWGRARNADGQTVELTMTTPESYALTAATTWLAVQRLLRGEVKPGAWTPSRAFGPDMVREVPGVEVGEMRRSS